MTRKYNQETVLIKLKNEPGHYYRVDGTFKYNFNTISKDVIEDYYTRLRNTTFTFTEVDDSDNLEHYTLLEKNYWSRALRYKMLQDFKRDYPDLYKDDLVYF